MILNFNANQVKEKNDLTFHTRSWHNRNFFTSNKHIIKNDGVRIEIEKMFYSFVFLFLSGIFTGIALMLSMT